MTDGDVSGLYMSVGAWNCLTKAGIRTIAELRTYSDQDLIQIRGLGVEGLKSIRNALKRNDEGPFAELSLVSRDGDLLTLSTPGGVRWLYRLETP